MPLDPSLPPGWANCRYAGFGRRLLAQIVDGLLFGMLALLLEVAQGVIHALQGLPVEEGSSLGGELMVQVIVGLAVLLFWASRLATPGKLLLGLRIVDARTGGRPSFPRMLARYLGYILSTLPLCLGYLWMLWDSHRQCWHDKLGGTVVLRLPRPSTDALP
ncbi:RDD family protein [Roseomonas sp. M0104]|uniref:RDD family protein n=1 Tax=Teichococcus coralli TaxID=2545983 RepID=A0A845BIV4_9PROT|nr:RDD family protein [Pseudoroseomonas coralli]MXP66000.1 RDD family protein [Pseudoroseomonas coralli]